MKDTITIEITEEEFKEFQHWFRHYDSRSKWAHRIFYGAVMVAAALGLAVGLVGDWANGLTVLLTSGLTLGLVTAIKWWQVREAFRAAKNRPLYAPRQMQFDATGITMTMPNSTGHNDWAVYQAAGETQSLFVLMVAKRMGQLIPKRALTAEQLSALRSLIEQNVPSAGR